MINTILELSTCHIPEADTKLLEKEGIFIVGVYEEGFYIATNSVIIDVSNDQRDYDQEYSPAFYNLIGYAIGKGCSHICLDCDADIIEELPTFDW